MTNSKTLPLNFISNLAPDKLIRMLWILLAVQLCLAITLKIYETTYQPVEPNAPLISFDLSSLTKIVIEQRNAGSKEIAKVILEKSDQQWKLPDYYSFPASSSKIDQLIIALRELKIGLPVSSSKDAAERFKVSPDNFERAVSFYDAHNKLSTLYLGSSPRFREAHVRMDNKDAIYVAPIADYLLSSTTKDWIDQGMARLKPSAITCIDFGTFKIEKSKDQWKLVTSSKSEPLHDSAVQNLVDTVADLGISSVIGTDKEVAYGKESPAFQYDVTMSDKRVLSYKFFQPPGTGSYVLKFADKNWYVGVDNNAVNRIKGFNVESLEKSEAEAEKKETALKSLKEQSAKVLPNRR
jgi:hypothetical protein